MRKFILLLSVSLLLSSCTYQDVVNYLMGKESNLNEEQKEQVNKGANSEPPSSYTQIVDERDTNNGRPR
ncbi:hypothetical protein [Flavobacterium davisii]|uniref:Lipoprotein n=1 Tax=Flavobacterium columnare TaxID=996 RepID=A0A8G0KS82_9FLAO|nr:hypothetical protein [Flavobacterium davisii]QYS89096.1 hypothetical protein JJC05_01250 [Flavobacterium davisii]